MSVSGTDVRDGVGVVAADPAAALEHRHGLPLSEPVTMVMFGITGDLSGKKLIPAIYDLAFRDLLPSSFDLVGFARDTEGVMDKLRRSVAEHARASFDPLVWHRLAHRIHMVQGSFDDASSYAHLAARLSNLDETRNKSGNLAFYLSVPPAAFASTWLPPD